eukprot:CAMPEP_0203747506 /NCGR_PEP_ID=MMETSP0098-20131031/2630_1 /ASSEMBLY_ACC=CAM_ASM_000208 /TAXON_ID=96639 /ORGANISM=" , Strain NY0313808BC1" /LENGTH=376 /DNA_ID=CAMNT_0050635945 /DNA_START=508 /DNA_END=1638 /DNA_ORIENTATION=+
MKLTITVCFLAVSFASASSYIDCSNTGGDGKLDRLCNAWKDESGNGGILIHGTTANYTSTVLKSTTKHKLFVDNDCGPMCSAWSYASSNIPLVPFHGATFFLMVDANSDFVKTYAQGMNPVDAITSYRQFCLKKPKSVSQIRASPYFNKTEGNCGCSREDKDCQFLAAGGSPSVGVLSDTRDSTLVKSLYRLTTSNSSMISEGKNPQCGIPHRCSTYFPKLTNGSGYITDIVNPAMNQTSDPFKVIMRNCRFDSQSTNDWGIFKDAYRRVLFKFRGGNPSNHSFARQNEVDFYKPCDEDEQIDAKISQENAIVGIFVLKGRKDAATVIEQAKEIVASYNKRYDKAQIHLYECEGHRTWKDYKITDTFTSPDGCTII